MLIVTQQDENRIDAIKDQIITQSRSRNPNKVKIEEFHQQIATIVDTMRERDRHDPSFDILDDATIAKDNKIEELKQEVATLSHALSVHQQQKEGLTRPQVAQQSAQRTEPLPDGRTSTYTRPPDGKYNCYFCQVIGHLQSECKIRQRMLKEYAYPLNEHRG